MPMALSIQITKFKFQKCQLSVTLPINLMLAKVSHYTVYGMVYSIYHC